MISKEILKEVIVSNEAFILGQVKNIIPREGIYYPEQLNKVVVLYGVRRSGKTFILYDLFKKFSQRAVYIDFEDDRLIGFDAQDFEKLKDSVLTLKPHLISQELVFLFDEIQNIEGWERFCRRAVERENIKIFATGSSSKMMPFEIQTELRGRAWCVEIMPLSFNEFLMTKGINTTDKNLFYGANKSILKSHFSEYIRWGGFPEVSLVESEFEKRKLLNEYMSAMFFRDMVERYGITNIMLIESLSDKLFCSFSLKFSLSSFYKQYKNSFSFSKDLLFRYYKYFIESMLMFEVRKFSESTYVRMRNPAKIYLIDTGLARRVTSSDSGRLLENTVYLELRRKGFVVFYFEEKRECDFIARNNDRVLPIQVCQEINEGNKLREIEGLIESCKYVGVQEGMIITYDDENELVEDGVHIRILPAWKWLKLM